MSDRLCWRQVIVYCMFLGCLCHGKYLYAQDFLPETAILDQKLILVDEQRLPGVWNDTLTYTVDIPSSFHLSGSNQICDPSGSLDSIWERMCRIRSGVSGDTLRILHIGDSHVRGHIYPRTVGNLLKSEFHLLEYVDMGVNGATCLSFTRADRLESIANSGADLIIVSFGTNESHNRRYNAHLHYQQLDELLSLIRDRLPNVPFLLTTPPGSYERYWVRRKRVYRVNPRTEEASATIVRYATDHRLAVWDLYRLVGGRTDACTNWQRSHLMRPDHVHFFAEGYMLQGSLLYQAILNAYNSYVIR